MRLLGPLVGGIVGYYAIAYPSCTWFWPDSNLCGIWGPVGLVAGAVLGYQIAVRSTKSKV